MEEDEDICRVCRSGGSPDNPLHYPCICTGSIRFVHQNCLINWIHHSQKESCELCNHKYTFEPVYRPDMPKRLPLKEILFEFMSSFWPIAKLVMYYTAIASAFLVAFPLIIAYIFDWFFNDSISLLRSLTKDVFYVNNFVFHLLFGYGIFMFFSGIFILMFCLRWYILNGHMPDWLLLEPRNRAQHQVERHNRENEEAQGVMEGEQAALPNAHNNNEIGIVLNDAIILRILGLDRPMFMFSIIRFTIVITLSILVFAYFPYHLGLLVTVNFNLSSYVNETFLESTILFLCGYILMGLIFLLCYFVLKQSKIHRVSKVFGVWCVMFKVGLLLAAQYVFFPLLCGGWLDICSLKAFNSTLQNRKEMYFSFPPSFILMHWMLGIGFVAYYSAFLIILRRTLRPGALCFVENIYNLEFGTIINKMIHIPVFQYLRHFFIWGIIFGFSMVVVAWLPIKILLAVPNSFQILPFSGDTVSAKTPMAEFLIQFSVVQVLFLGFVEHGQGGFMIEAVIRGFAQVFGSLLGIKSYLLGNDAVILHGPNLPINLQNNNERAVKNENPSYFSIRIAALLLFVAVTLAVANAAMLSIPMYVGQKIINPVFNMMGLSSVLPSRNSIVLHDVFTHILGCSLICNFFRVGWAALNWLPKSWTTIKKELIDISKIVMKIFVFSCTILTTIPLLLGVLLGFLVLIPLRVAHNQSPLISLWENWGLGVFLLKMFFILIIIGPDNWLKRDIERALDLGIERLSLLHFFRNTFMPVVLVLLSCICIPYVACCIVLYLYNFTPLTANFLKTRAHLFLFVIFGLIWFIKFVTNRLILLCNNIKNKKYLIGQHLQNYVPPNVND